MDAGDFAWLGVFPYQISEPSHDLRRHGMAVASGDSHC